MTVRTQAILMSISISLMAGACASEPVIEDELAGESEADDASKADDPTSTYTFYEIRPDYRRCSFPHCGGFFVSRANRSSTRCEDGAYADECYVATLDTLELGLNDAQLDQLHTAIGARSALLRGQIHDDTAVPGFGAFVATEAWTAGPSIESEGVFVQVADNGVRCFAAPCESFTERKLNSNLQAAIAGVDFTDTGATEQELEPAYTALHHTSLIARGYRDYTSGPAGTARMRTATQFFTQLFPLAAGSCFATGCSGQICADRDVASTCEWRPEYACYDTARCEMQADGGCGWTQTAELEACLEDADF
jgi:hypothetical protein